MLDFLSRILKNNRRKDAVIVPSSTDSTAMNRALCFQKTLEDFKVDYQSLTILVIDDNHFLLDTIRIFLEGLGIAVDSASNGQVGLQMYLSAPDKYDIILTDIEMPIMSGIETAKRIRESTCSSAGSILIVAITGSMFCDDPGMPLFSSNIKKPFNIDALETLIKQTLLQQYLLEK